MSKETLMLNANIETRKKLVGIAKNVAAKSISSWLSSGAEILSTEKEVRDTKQVSVLIPFLVGVKKVADVLAEAEAGAVSAKKGKVGERVVILANELITEPLIWRPRDGETIQADVLLTRYQEGFTVSANVIKDRAFFKTILTQGIAGLSTGEKIEIVDTTAAAAKTTAEEKGAAYKALIDDATVRIMEHFDDVIQGDFDNNDIAVATSPKVHKYLNALKKEVIKTDAAYKEYAASSSVQIAGLYDGIHEFNSTKQLKSVDIDFIVMVKGAAVSQFLFMDFMNYDKVAGVNAYKLSLEFNEGTGLYFPQLITIGALTAKHAAQAAVGSGATLDLMTNVVSSTTTSTKPA